MTTEIVKLTTQEIAEAKKQAEKYNTLIQKELIMGDLVNLDNIARYAKEYKSQMALVANGYIEMPKF